jgi:hypothetical protein
MNKFYSKSGNWTYFVTRRDFGRVHVEYALEFLHQSDDLLLKKRKF